MRVMCDKKGNEYKVIRWILMRNFWEYYITEIDGDTTYGYVMGFENEWGYSSLSEKVGYTLEDASGDKLNEIAPPIGFYWKDSENYKYMD